MKLPVIISLIFFLAFVLYFFFGIYTLSLNKKSVLHRVFFCICLALSIWAFSFSIANSAAAYAESLFWKRMSALGWGVCYSLILHFVLILTEKKRILKIKWIYILIYAPALIVILTFGLIKDIADKQYFLVSTYAGWANITQNTVWDYFFYIYYMGYSILGITLIYLWGRSSVEHEKKKQSYWIVGSFTFAFFAGTITEIAMNMIFTSKVPQIAPVILSIPVTAMLLCIKKYGLMAPALINQVAAEGQILSEASRIKVYVYLTRAYILGSFMYFVTRYLINRHPLALVMQGCLVILVCGIMLQLIQRLRVKSELKDTLCAIIVAASIPYMILAFSKSAAVTVWVVPFIFVLVSVAFSNRKMLLLIGTVTFMTLIWVWVKTPEWDVLIDISDHIVRIGLFGTFLIIAFYINHIYMHRLAENEEQVRFQKLLSQVSASFVPANVNNIEEIVIDMLKKCCEHFQVDCASIYLFSEDKETVSCTYRWIRDRVEPVTNVVEKDSFKMMPACLNQLLTKGILYVPDVNEKRNGGNKNNPLIDSTCAKSLIAVPICNKDKIIGFIRFDNIATKKAWREDHQEMLKVLANLLADALSKVEAEKEINYMAYYDIMTGLPNRTLLKNRLEQAINLAARSVKLVGVIFIDIDSFKAINDTLGHNAGNALLGQVAQRLSDNVRKYDTVSRFGGDEFIIMIPQASEVNDIKCVMEKILEAFYQPLLYSNQEFFIKLSAGISIFPIDGDDPEQLIKCADLAMYNAKEGGKNRYSLYSTNMEKDALANMELTNSLYRALERGELFLNYQPQVCNKSGVISGVEALLRWKHPRMGMISPSVLIPIAERTGLINPIGQWVLREACGKYMEWKEQGLPLIRVSVNLSIVQLKNPNLLGIVDSILRETGMEPDMLELEITESIDEHEERHIIDTLSKLKELGVSISIDDFGTRYSSLGRLKTLPVDRIKIDMHFIRGISKGSKEEGIINVIVLLAETLGLKVTAEGVETEEQREFFRNSACDEIQGYYFYKPMAENEIKEILIKAKQDTLIIDQRHSLLPLQY